MSIKDNFPTVRPQLLIDISNTEVLDPRVVTSRASVGTYYDKFGVLQTADANEPRVGYTPSTGDVEGLIREAQGTNLLTYSEDFGNASWAKSNATITSNTIVAPDNSLTGDKLVESSATGYHSISKSSGTASVVNVFSSYIKAAERESVVLGISDLLAISYNLTNGAMTVIAGGASIVSKGSEYVGNGWYKCWFSITGVGTFQIFPAIGSTYTYTGDGVSGVYIWGAQVEASSYPTSYIKTEASQVTRAADTFLLTNTADYSTDAFTAISQPFGVTSVSSGTVTLNGDVPIERLYVYPNNIAQDEINSVVENDGWWSWRIVGATFALPYFATDGSIQVDWGDGTVETLTTAVHTFTNPSPHTVKFRQMTGTYFAPIIAGNATYKDMVVALGSAPSNMIVDCAQGFYGCNNLKSFDATLSGKTNYIYGWLSCTSLPSFPFIDTSLGTNFQQTWQSCTGLTSFPLIDTGSGTNFTGCWQSCTGLTSFPLLDTSAGTTFTGTWYQCNTLTSFPLLDTSAGTNFSYAWYLCSGLTSFPLLNTSAGTNFQSAWQSCTSLTSFPLIDTGSGTNFAATWYENTSLTSFPLIDTGSGTNFTGCWQSCTSLTSFPLIDTSSGTNFAATWYENTSLTSFPLINTSAGTTFSSTWRLCTSLTSFPANMFDSWVGVPFANCFSRTWENCISLTTTSVENILVSIDTSGQPAPAGTDAEREITIDYNVATGALTAPTTSAITSLKGKNWTIRINGVLQ